MEWKLIIVLTVLCVFSCSEKDKKHKLKDLLSYHNGKNTIEYKTKINDTIFLLKGIINNKIKYSGQQVENKKKEIIKVGKWYYYFDKNDYVVEEYNDIFLDNSVNQLKFYIDDKLVFGKFYILEQYDDKIIINFYHSLVVEKECFNNILYTIKNINGNVIIDNKSKLTKKGKFLQNEISIKNLPDEIIINALLASDCNLTSGRARTEIFLKDTIKIR